MASFDLAGRVAVVTGGYGVLGGSMAEALGRAGARVVVLGRDHAAAERKAVALQEAGVAAMGLVADVLDERALVQAREALLAEWGRVDILVNAAGGHVAEARTDHVAAFEMSLPAYEAVVRLNLHGTVYPTLVFGEAMARQGKGSVVNISSMAATLALSGVLGYSVAKAAVESFTRWMAVDLARRFGEAAWRGRGHGPAMVCEGRRYPRPAAPDRRAGGPPDGFGPLSAGGFTNPPFCDIVCESQPL